MSLHNNWKIIIILIIIIIIEEWRMIICRNILKEINMSPAAWRLLATPFLVTEQEEEHITF